VSNNNFLVAARRAKFICVPLSFLFQPWVNGIPDPFSQQVVAQHGDPDEKENHEEQARDQIQIHASSRKEGYL
jgi:hypothetical protein